MIQSFRDKQNFRKAERKTGTQLVKVADRGALQTTRSYLFIDKHPVIDEIRALMQDARYSRKKLAEESGVCVTTLRNWDLGRTIRPQAPTLNAVARVFGKRLGLVDL
jgi:DNA-binding transcriptional regulator YiaG